MYILKDILKSFLRYNVYKVMAEDLDLKKPWEIYAY